MRTYLGLLTNALRSALRSKHDLMLENLALRQQLALLTRQRARTRTKPSRASLLVVALPVLARLAFHPGDGAAGDGHPLAPHGVARVLDVEEPSPTRERADMLECCVTLLERHGDVAEPSNADDPRSGRPAAAW